MLDSTFVCVCPRGPLSMLMSEEVLLFAFANIVKYRTSEFLYICRSVIGFARTRKHTFLSKTLTDLTFPANPTNCSITIIAQETFSNRNLNYVNAADTLSGSL